MAELTKAQLEQELAKLTEILNSIRKPLVDGNLIPADASNAHVVMAVTHLPRSASFARTVCERLLKEGLIDDVTSLDKTIQAINDLIERGTLHAAELEARDAIIGELRAHPLMIVDSETGKVTAVDSFAAEAMRNLAQGVPAPAGDITEAEIREKTLAGLDRKTAIQVIRAQRAEDAPTAS